MVLSRRGGPLLIAGVLAVIAAPAWAGWDVVAGRWANEALTGVDSADCAPTALSVAIGKDSNAPAVTVKAEPLIDLDVTLTRGKDSDVFIERGGWMKRFGMSDETTRDALIGHKPVLWARETGTGAVIYRARITKDGTLNILRLALEPVDGGIAATLDLTQDDCRIEALTAALTAR